MWILTVAHVIGPTKLKQQTGIVEQIVQYFSMGMFQLLKWIAYVTYITYLYMQIFDIFKKVTKIVHYEKMYV